MCINVCNLTNKRMARSTKKISIKAQTYTSSNICSYLYYIIDLDICTLHSHTNGCVNLLNIIFYDYTKHVKLSSFI